jgi:Leucine-rich repeat (LRR) protein
MSRQEIEKELDEWVSGSTTGNRASTRNEILKAYTSQATSLNLSGMDLGVLPECIGQLVNLQELHLRSCKLETLPESFGNLVNLKILDLDKNNIKTLPLKLQEFWQNKKLERASSKKTCQKCYGSVLYTGNYEGTRTDADGTVLSGRFERFRFPWDRIELVQGTKTYPDGRVEQGQWRQSTMTGLMKRVGPKMNMPVALGPEEHWMPTFKDGQSTCKRTATAHSWPRLVLASKPRFKTTARGWI